MTATPNDVYPVTFVPSEETVGGYVADDVVYLPLTLKDNYELAGSFARTLSHYGMTTNLDLLNSENCYPIRQYAMLIENIRCDIEITQALNGRADLNDIANYLIREKAFAVPDHTELWVIALLVGRAEMAGIAPLEPMAKRAKKKMESDLGSEKASKMIELVHRIANITSTEESLALAKVFNEFWPIEEPELWVEYDAEDEALDTSKIS